MHVFYAPDIELTHQLPEEESMHCVRVLRLKEGDKISITDGKGSFYTAVISAAHQKRCLVEILEKHPQPALWTGYLHLAIAPTKNMDRNEWFAEKATEIGFDELTFLNCRFSERKVIKNERIEKILVSAIKQSLKARRLMIRVNGKFCAFTLSKIMKTEYIAAMLNWKQTLMLSFVWQISICPMVCAGTFFFIKVQTM